MDPTDAPSEIVVDFGPEVEAMKRMRGEVVERFAQIESVMDFVVSVHYGREIFRFYQEVTANEHFSWALRRSLFENVARARSRFDDKEDQNLRRIASLRNLFAHASKRVSSVTEDWKPLTRFVSPKTPGSWFDPAPSFEEFERCEAKAKSYVHALQTLVVASLSSPESAKAGEQQP